jgi:hypothetical protein
LQLNNSNIKVFNIIFLAIGVAIGAGAIYFLLKGKSATKTKMEASIMLEKIEKVFKVVTAEGHFSEVFDYEQTSKTALIIPSTKKALLIVNAKVLMGYDFKKCKWQIDADSKKVSILEFPAPEILSIEQDVKYYNMENGIFNKFDNADLTALQVEAKKKIVESVNQSTLPTVAQKQMKELLNYLKEENKWQLLGEEKLLALPSPATP